MNSLKRKIKNAVFKLRLSASARTISESNLTYLSPQKLTRLEGALARAIKDKVPGDILEFGVALGGSAIVLAKHALGSGRRFAGFDVFAMIPPPSSEKDDGKSKQRYEVIANGKAIGIGGETYYGYRENLYDEVTQSLVDHGVIVDGNNVMLVKGLFEETWPNYQTAGVCFAHIDCDWYDPVKFCLTAMRDKLNVGGAIVLDDYNDYGGYRTATDEFLAENPAFRIEKGVNPIVRRA